MCFFKQKTAYEMRISDWSSDVCASDLKALCTSKVPGSVIFVPPTAKLPCPAIINGFRLFWAFSDMDEANNNVTAHRFFINFLFKIGRASCRERVCQYV